MNEDQIKGAVKKIAGKVQEDFGKMVGNKEQQNKGVRKQVIGNAQQNYGKAIEAVKNSRRHI